MPGICKSVQRLSTKTIPSEISDNTYKHFSGGK